MVQRLKNIFFAFYLNHYRFKINHHKLSNYPMSYIKIEPIFSIISLSNSLLTCLSFCSRATHNSCFSTISPSLPALLISFTDNFSFFFRNWRFSISFYFNSIPTFVIFPPPRWFILSPAIDLIHFL